VGFRGHSNFILAPVSTRCEGVETYDEDLSDNGFLARLGKGLSIVKVSVEIKKQ
jgi:hypothetical protein